MKATTSARKLLHARLHWVPLYALLLATGCPERPTDENNPPPTQQRACEPTIQCTAALPDARCQGRLAVAFERDALGCTCEPIKTLTDCAALGQRCEGGTCAELPEACEGISCPALAPRCDGSVSVSTVSPGICTDDGACDYTQAESRTDCAASGLMCMDGKCISACAFQSCEQPQRRCDGEVRVTYSGDGVCMLDRGQATCDYSAVEVRSDCSASGKTCMNGRCKDPNTPCAGTTCDAPPAPECDGDVAVTHEGEGACVEDTGECDYSMVEVRTDCAMMGQACMNGACIEPVDPCDMQVCTPPMPSCDGAIAVTHTGDGACQRSDGSCDYSMVEIRTDCAMMGQSCDGGACIDPMMDLCMNVTCDQPMSSCDGDDALTYSGAGICDSMTGTCDYSAVETRTDCEAMGQVCDAGACVDPMMDLCMNVTCDQPMNTCDMNTAVSYTGAGMCDVMTGMCDFSAVETRTDCEAMGQVCQVDTCVDLCAGVTCDQPMDTCDGDDALTYSGAGMCDAMTGMCDFSAVETRTDCTATAMTCQMGMCM